MRPPRTAPYASNKSQPEQHGLPDRDPAGCATARLYGIPLHAVTHAQCVDIVIDSLRRDRGGWIVTLNLDHLRRCVGNPRYAAIVRMADLCVADGMPLVWASRLLGVPMPERVTGSDLIFLLHRALARHGRSSYLLGGSPGTAARAAEVLQEKYPGLRIAGTCCPPLGFERDPATLRQVAKDLVAAAPDVVFVALGSPKQDYLIRILRVALPRTWWIGVGISFSFVCGDVQRAPTWMQRFGIEWLHRLAQEPGRLWRRYLVQGVPFSVRLMTHVLLGRIVPGDGDPPAGPHEASAQPEP